MAAQAGASYISHALLQIFLCLSRKHNGCVEQRISWKRDRSATLITGMAGLQSLMIGYLALTHALLYASSPYYRHEVSRALHGIKTAVVAHSSRSNDAKLPKSGVYASTDLLRVVQQQMLWGDQHSHSGPGANASAAVPALVYSTRHNRLIAYLSATDVLHGEGWKARAAFFVFLLAPRYVLTSTGGKFAPEIQLLDLASKDLPAVGLLQRSEVGTRQGRSRHQQAGCRQCGCVGVRWQGRCSRHPGGERALGRCIVGQCAAGNAAGSAHD